jgi:hypothetical protein
VERSGFKGQAWKPRTQASSLALTEGTGRLTPTMCSRDLEMPK